MMMMMLTMKMMESAEFWFRKLCPIVRDRFHTFLMGFAERWNGELLNAENFRFDTS
jgi:hypothetical protein